MYSLVHTLGTERLGTRGFKFTFIRPADYVFCVDLIADSEYMIFQTLEKQFGLINEQKRTT